MGNLSFLKMLKSILKNNLAKNLKKEHVFFIWSNLNFIILVIIKKTLLTIT